MEDAYEKIVYWRRNLFLLPAGNVSKNYIDELTRLLIAGLARMLSDCLLLLITLISFVAAKLILSPVF